MIADDWLDLSALIRVRCTVLGWKNAPEWPDLPLLNRWKNPIERYHLSIDEYRLLAWQLGRELYKSNFPHSPGGHGKDPTRKQLRIPGL